jgi:hypothetical protein
MQRFLHAYHIRIHRADGRDQSLKPSWPCTEDLILVIFIANVVTHKLQV